jgi:hypothetical protein
LSLTFLIYDTFIKQIIILDSDYPHQIPASPHRPLNSLLIYVIFLVYNPTKANIYPSSRSSTNHIPPLPVVLLELPLHRTRIASTRSLSLIPGNRLLYHLLQTKAHTISAIVVAVDLGMEKWSRCYDYDDVGPKRLLGVYVGPGYVGRSV